jgi:hypothetical protein
VYHRQLSSSLFFPHPPGRRRAAGPGGQAPGDVETFASSSARRKAIKSEDGARRSRSGRDPRDSSDHLLRRPLAALAERVRALDGLEHLGIPSLPRDPVASLNPLWSRQPGAIGV